MSTVDCLLIGLNSVQLIGYSGSDPLKGSTDHQPTKFSLATTQYYQSREGKGKLQKKQWKTTRKLHVIC